MTGMRDLQRWGLGKYFSYPKPVALLEMLVEAATGPTDLVMDFFAGSGTTAEAVAAVNRRDGGSRNSVLMQLDEPLGIDGYRTIADVTRARLNAAKISYQDVRLVAQNRAGDTSQLESAAASRAAKGSPQQPCPNQFEAERQTKKQFTRGEQ